MSNEYLNLSRNQDEMPTSSIEAALRPPTLAEFVGQDSLKENLRVFIEAAKARKEPLDHCLFYSPPGLGKTTLSNILAREMGVNIKVTSGPVLARPGDLAAMLTTELNEGDILFIDEIHRLNPAVEEALYPAMEDFTFFINTGKGAGSTQRTERQLRLNKSRKIALQPSRAIPNGRDIPLRVGTMILQHRSREIPKSQPHGSLSPIPLPTN